MQNKAPQQFTPMLNRGQRIIIILAALILILIALFPPWYVIVNEERKFVGFQFVFSVYEATEIDMTLTSILVITVIIVTVLLVIATNQNYRVTSGYQEAASDMGAVDEYLYNEDKKESDSALVLANDGNQAHSVAEMIRDRAAEFISKNRLLEATQLLQRSLSNWPENIPIGKSDYQVLLYLLGHLYAHGGKSTEAEDLFQRIIEIREFILGPNHPGMIEVVEDYATLMERTGNSASAKYYRSVSERIRETLDREDYLEPDPEEIKERGEKITSIELPPLPLSATPTFDPEKVLSGTMRIKLGPPSS
ncbi:tetratricopeptide repeat protein [bacterium]|nr:tetratricopeptide repeat protein [bacterium]